MDRQPFERIIMTWKQGVPARAYDETCAFWAENGTFTVYRAAGNPGDWGRSPRLLVELAQTSASSHCLDELVQRARRWRA